MRKRIFSLLAFGALAAISTSAGASTIRTDKADSLYTTLATLPEYSGVGKVIHSTASGSGTLISSQWVLTAAHMVKDKSALQFVLGGTTYTADYSTYYSGYDTSNYYGDLALVHISSAISGVTYATLYSGTTSDLVSNHQTATYVGYGYNGTGTSGFTTNTYGTKRAFQNKIDEIASDYISTWPANDLLSDFDSPGGAKTHIGDGEPLSLEGNIAPGDSGGGVFVNIGGTTYLAGVISLLGSTDGTKNANYGDFSMSVSVTDFSSWIYSTMSAYEATIPEPASMSLLLSGGLWLLKRRK